jgi:hypothetical protein
MSQLALVPAYPIEIILMKLFLLSRPSLHVGIDEYSQHLIRAETEQRARELANAAAIDEGQIWTDPDLAHCIILTNDGPEEIIISNFRSG